MYKKLGCIMVVSTLVGCSGLTRMNVWSDPPDLYLEGNEQGIKALTDSYIGVVNETKTPPDLKSSHYQLRERQEQTRALQFKFNNRGQK